MKYKYFLRGLGFGIILSALILCISYRSSGSNESIVDQAKKLGMVFPEGTQPPEPVDEITPTETPAPTQNSSGAGVTGGETVQPTATVPPQPTATVPSEPVVTAPPKPTATAPPKVAAKATAKPKPKQTKEPVSTKTSGNGKEFKVRGGLLSSSVAREMKAAGIIQNDKKLDKYLVDNGYATKIREGIYRIPVGASYEQIAKIITRTK